MKVKSVENHCLVQNMLAGSWTDQIANYSGLIIPLWPLSRSEHQQFLFFPALQGVHAACGGLDVLWMVWMVCVVLKVSRAQWPGRFCDFSPPRGLKLNGDAQAPAVSVFVSTCSKRLADCQVAEYDNQNDRQKFQWQKHDKQMTKNMTGQNSNDKKNDTTMTNKMTDKTETTKKHDKKKTTNKWQNECVDFSNFWLAKILLTVTSYTISGGKHNGEQLRLTSSFGGHVWLWHCTSSQLHVDSPDLNAPYIST